MRNNFSVLSCFSFLFRSSKFLTCLVSKLHLNHHKALILFLFILQFYLVILLLPEFFTVARHDLIHSSSVHQYSRSRSSSIFFFLHLEVRLILCILLKWSFAFLHFPRLFIYFSIVVGYHLIILRCFQ